MLQLWALVREGDDAGVAQTSAVGEIEAQKPRPARLTHQAESAVAHADEQPSLGRGRARSR